MKQFNSDGTEVKVPEKIEKDRQAAFDAIRKKAILVNMSHRQISNIPFDVQLSDKVAKDIGMGDKSMLQIRKCLFNPERLSKVRSLINDALLMVWNHTRPWDNIGFRLLPMEYYDDFNDTFGKIKDEFEEAVNEFADNYLTYVDESKKLLGPIAFRKEDYPDVNNVRKYFNLEIHTSVFPEIDDIRLNMSGPELVAMQKEITEKYEGVINETMTELLNLVSNNADGGTIAKHIKMVEKLNIGSNPEIDLKLSEIKATLGTPIKSDTPTKESMMVMDDIDDLEDIMDDYI